MEYRKERQFIVAYDGEKMCGKWDILNNQFIGIKGKPIQSRPSAFSVATIRTIDNQPFASALKVIHDYRCYDYNNLKAQRIEAIISVGLKLSNDYSTWMNLEHNTIPLTKKLVQYLNDYCDGYYRERYIEQYTRYEKYSILFTQFPDNSEWINNVINRMEDVIPNEWVVGMVKRAIHEKIFSYVQGYQFGDILFNWYTYITTLGDTLEVKHNILTNYAILQWLYKEYKNAHYNEMLQKNNNNPALYYENDNYIVTPLLTREAFHNEADAQHNCVERLYMEQVANGNTHVVVVRKKSCPNTSYITCEVSNDGRIIQYLYRYNQRVYDMDDINFRDEYQTHLHSSLNES